MRSVFCPKAVYLSSAVKVIFRRPRWRGWSRGVPRRSSARWKGRCQSRCPTSGIDRHGKSGRRASARFPEQHPRRRSTSGGRHRASPFRARIQWGIRQCIFDRVVEQDRDELAHGVLVAAIGEAVRDRKAQLVPLRRGEVDERFRRFAHGVAHGELLHPERRILLVHARERDERVDERGELFRLRHRLVDPFLLAGLHFEHLEARGNDGDGRFQFVARVGDELLLLLRAANHWVDGPAREQHDKQEDEQDARRVGEQRPHEHHAHRTQLVVAVEEDGDILAVIRLRDEKSDNC